MKYDGRITSTSRAQWGLAIVVMGAVIALAWYGYRATTEWQSSSAVLVERHERDLANLLVTAVTRDMRGVQVSVLSGPEWNTLHFEPPYEIDDVVLTAFARYPYPESFFGWRTHTNNTLFFTRADRPPTWAPRTGGGAQYPVNMPRNDALATQLHDRIARDAAFGREYAAFNMTLDGQLYEVVARLVYQDTTRQRLDCVFGFMVDLEWARRHYFPDIAQQASHVGAATEGLEYAISDDRGALVAGAERLKSTPGTITRSFAALFIDPTFVALDPPADLLRPTWHITVGAGPDSALELAARASQRTFVVVTGAAFLAGLGLFVTVRAAHANAHIAAMRSDFVSAVTHELKTPLATIRTIADTLVRGRLSTGDQLQSYAELLVREERRLARLIDNLLAYARVTDVAEVYSFEPVSVDEMIAEVLNRFDRQFSDGGFRLHVNVDASLPDVTADRTALVLALDNLVDNAIRYSGGATCASLRARRVGTLIEFEVRDQGIGIAADELERVQRRFVRGRTSTSHGSGLGLAIVRRIAHDHGGDLRIESQVGVGTLVTLAIPATSENEARVEANSHR